MSATTQRILLILSMLLLGCGTTSKVSNTVPIVEKYNDVLILSELVQDYLRQSNAENLNVHDLIEKDPLKRISNSFERTELKSHAGYISLYYKRIKPGNIKIELTEREKERFKGIRLGLYKKTGMYDGEIRFDFGERFYRIKRILVQKEGAF